jgi:adenosine deaminase
VEAIEKFITRLPKVELHVHLIGSAPVETVLQLARRHPDSGVPRTAEELRRFYEFRDFPQRIGHGIRSMDDPRLVAYLRERQLPVDVSPTSNVRTRCVPSLKAHPLPSMLDAGLFVTLNSDDPPMFGTSLTGEYLAAARLGLGAAELAGLAANGVRASFLDDAAAGALLGEIATVLAAHE